MSTTNRIQNLVDRNLTRAVIVAAFLFALSMAIMIIWGPGPISAFILMMCLCVTGGYASLRLTQRQITAIVHKADNE